jgi:hypothetical protein
MVQNLCAVDFLSTLGCVFARVELSCSMCTMPSHARVSRHVNVALYCEIGPRRRLCYVGLSYYLEIASHGNRGTVNGMSCTSLRSCSNSTPPSSMYRPYMPLPLPLLRIHVVLLALMSQGPVRICPHPALWIAKIFHLRFPPPLTVM